MTAQEAAIITEDNLIAGMKTIISAIKKGCAQDGKYSIGVKPESITKEQIDALRRRSFFVTPDVMINGRRMTEISWEHFKQ